MGRTDRPDSGAVDVFGHLMDTLGPDRMAGLAQLAPDTLRGVVDAVLGSERLFPMSDLDEERRQFVRRVREGA